MNGIIIILIPDEGKNSSPSRDKSPFFQTTAPLGYLRSYEQRFIIHEIITAGHGWIWG